MWVILSESRPTFPIQLRRSSYRLFPPPMVPSKLSLLPLPSSIPYSLALPIDGAGDDVTVWAEPTGGNVTSSSHDWVFNILCSQADHSLVCSVHFISLFYRHVLHFITSYFRCLFYFFLIAYTINGSIQVYWFRKTQHSYPSVFLKLFLHINLKIIIFNYSK